MDYAISDIDANHIIDALAIMDRDSLASIYAAARDAILENDPDETREYISENAVWYANDMVESHPYWNAVQNAGRPALITYQVVSWAMGFMHEKTRLVSPETLENGGFFSGDFITNCRPGERWLRTLIPGLPAEEVIR